MMKLPRNQGLRPPGRRLALNGWSWSDVRQAAGTMIRVPGVLRPAIDPGRFTYRMSFTCCRFETKVCRAGD